MSTTTQEAQPPMEEIIVGKDERKTTAASIQVVESQGFDAKETKRLLRKLDWHLLPIMSLIYL
jgi:hypothetical protein